MLGAHKSSMGQPTRAEYSRAANGSFEKQHASSSLLVKQTCIDLIQPGADQVLLGDSIRLSSCPAWQHGRTDKLIKRTGREHPSART
jgi:hypothetical protein